MTEGRSLTGWMEGPVWGWALLAIILAATVAVLYFASRSA